MKNKYIQFCKHFKWKYTLGIEGGNTYFYGILMAELTSERIKILAGQAGFDLCGIASPEILPEAKRRFEEWLASGYHGEMAWMEQNVERRTDPNQLMEPVKSVIILGLNYYQPNSDEVPKGHGRVSRYARGKDYHKVIRKRTEHLLSKINDELPSNAQAEFKWWVDYGPFMERAYAEMAGIGYIGKNGMLINKQFGSWLFISEIVTNLELEPDKREPREHGNCSTCTLCIDACPTEAILSPRVIDSNKCISYLTIERPSEIPGEIKPKIRNLIFGCDICQEVCPHNLSRQTLTMHKEFSYKYGVGEFVDARKVLELEDRDEFLEMFAGTPLVRPKEDCMKRNAEIVLENEKS